MVALSGNHLAQQNAHLGTTCSGLIEIYGVVLIGCPMWQVRSNLTDHAHIIKPFTRFSITFTDEDILLCFKCIRFIESLQIDPKISKLTCAISKHFTYFDDRKSSLEVRKMLGCLNCKYENCIFIC